jgi:hypothetical protein
MRAMANQNTIKEEETFGDAHKGRWEESEEVVKTEEDLESSDKLSGHDRVKEQENAMGTSMIDKTAKITMMRIEKSIKSRITECISDIKNEALYPSQMGPHPIYIVGNSQEKTSAVDLKS